MAYAPTTDPNINPFGAVAVFDSESPCIVTGLCNGTVSGGQFVMASGTNGAVVGSGVGQYASSDILVQPALLNDNVLGMALYKVTSGTSNYVAVARKGSFLVQATDPVSGGFPVTFNSGGVVNICSTAGSATIPVIGKIGRAHV